MFLRSVVPSNENIEPKAHSLRHASFDIITTTYNEESSIIDFLNSIYHQSIQANSLIICDAGSKDKTVSLIKSWQEGKGVNVVIIESQHCSIAQGRNKAASISESHYLLFADAGTSLDKKWSEQIIYSFLSDEKIDLVAAWYKPISRNRLQKAFAWFVLPDIKNVNPETFLPSARSMGIKKKLFELVGGFPEHLTFAAEDTLFAIYAKSACRAVSFNKEAFCYWELPSNFFSMLKKLFLYSKGDGEIGGLNSTYYLVTFDKLFPIFIDSLFFFLLLPLLPVVSYLFLALFIYRIIKLGLEYGLHIDSSIKDILFRSFVLVLALPIQLVGFALGFVKGKKIEEKNLLAKEYVVMMLEESVCSEKEIRTCMDLIKNEKYLVVLYNKFSDSQVLHAFMESYKRSNFDFELWHQKHSKFIKKPVEVIDRVNDSLSAQLTKKFLS